MLDDQIASVMLQGIRVFIFFLVSPLFSDSYLPNSIRTIIIMSFVLLVPVQTAESVLGNFSFSCVYQELFIGLFLGLTVRISFSALSVIGTIIAQSMSISQIFGANNTEHMPAISHFFRIGGVILIIISGFFPLLVRFLSESYAVVGLCHDLRDEDIMTLFFAGVDKMFALSFLLALPFVVLSLFYNVMIGVVNRAMPQMMVALVGAPLITFVGIFTLVISIGIILQIWVSYFFQFPNIW